MQNVERCYLCNCGLVDNKVYEQMFEERINIDSKEQQTLAAILETVLGKKLQEMQVHSTYLCSTCKVSLLNYEAMAEQLFRLRYEIIEMHSQTMKLYGSNMSRNCSSISLPDSADCSEREEYEEQLDVQSDFMLNEQFFQEMENNAAESSALLDQCLDSDADLNFIERCSEEEDMDLLEQCSQQSEVNTQSIMNTDAAPAQKAPPKQQTKGRPRSASSAQFKCSYCDKICQRHSTLVEHERIHTGERPFMCEECGASFAQRSNLQSHLKATHLNVSSFRCKDCGRDYKRRRLLDNHIKSVHRKVRDFNCTHCNASFYNAISLKKHMTRHTGEKNYSCRICGKQFRSPENRNVHHFVHSIRKPYACSVCNEGFMRKQQLINHGKLQNHPNPKIVRLQPLFSAANSDKIMLQRLPATSGQSIKVAS